MKISIDLNGAAQTFEADARLTLLHLLRREGLHSVKHGCESGDCGACTVLLDGRPVVCCVMLAVQADGKSVVTLEGAGGWEPASRLQGAFVETGAIQCGYCTPAMILAAAALLERRPGASEEDVREALAGVLCRCTGYVKPVEAVLRAARAGGGDGGDE